MKNKNILIIGIIAVVIILGLGLFLVFGNSPVEAETVGRFEAGTSYVQISRNGNFTASLHDNNITGKVSQDGNTLTFVISGGETKVGSIIGTQLTVNLDGHSHTFVKV